jgi:DNA polymerase/3'-5' exonuclease PolX
MSGERKRWPIEFARELAGYLKDGMQGHCSRVEIAGSIRRGKAMVGDVELVYESPALTDLFGEALQEVRADELLNDWLSSGIIEPRRSVTGSISWGREIKLAVHVASGIPVDLFAARPGGWHSYLMCRTGSRIHNEAIAREMMGRSMRWEPYEGVRLRDGSLRRVGSEAELYAMIGWPYLEPEEREAERLLARGLIAPCHMPVK